MTDAFEEQARALAFALPICDLGSGQAIQAVAIGLRETWRMARASRDAEVQALMEKADNFERSTLAGWRRAIEAEEKVATTIDDAMRTARNRDMWKGQCERQAAEMTRLRADLAVLQGWSAHPDQTSPMTVGPEAALCSDCPPTGYPTDETRCSPCPRRQPSTTPTTRGAK
jgi:hypothetical protein